MKVKDLIYQIITLRVMLSIQLGRLSAAWSDTEY